MAAYGAVLAVHRDAGKVAHVLVGPGELVEQCGLSAVLVAYQRERQQAAFRQGVAAALGVELAFLAQTGVIGKALFAGALLGGDVGGYGRGVDFIRVGYPEGELVAPEPEFHGVAHGRQFYQRDIGAGDNAHVQKMLP